MADVIGPKCNNKGDDNRKGVDRYRKNLSTDRSPTQLLEYSGGEEGNAVSSVYNSKVYDYPGWISVSFEFISEPNLPSVDLPVTENAKLRFCIQTIHFRFRGILL